MLIPKPALHHSAAHFIRDAMLAMLHAQTLSLANDKNGDPSSA
jgi:hypothetical protein